MSQHGLLALLSGFLLFALVGCASFAGTDLSAEGAKASALCIAGGPGGLSGIGPGGVVAGAKVNEDFKGSITVAPNCALSISSN